jgi:hypothetical protein
MLTVRITWKRRGKFVSEVVMTVEQVQLFMSKQDVTLIILWAVRGSNPCRGRRFPVPNTSRPAVSPTQPPVYWVPGGKGAGLLRWLLTMSSAEVKNEWR